MSDNNNDDDQCNDLTSDGENLNDVPAGQVEDIDQAAPETDDLHFASEEEWAAHVEQVRSEHAKQRLQEALENRRLVESMRENPSDLRPADTLAVALKDVWQLDLLIYTDEASGRLIRPTIETEPTVTAKTLYIRTTDNNLLDGISEAFSEKSCHENVIFKTSKGVREAAERFLFNLVRDWYGISIPLSIKVCNVSPILNSLRLTYNVEEVVAYKATPLDTTTEAYVKAQKAENSAEPTSSTDNEPIRFSVAPKGSVGVAEISPALKERWKELVTGISFQQPATSAGECADSKTPKENCTGFCSSNIGHWKAMAGCLSPHGTGSIDLQ